MKGRYGYKIKLITCKQDRRKIKNPKNLVFFLWLIGWVNRAWEWKSKVEKHRGYLVARLGFDFLVALSDQIKSNQKRLFQSTCK